MTAPARDIEQTRQRVLARFGEFALQSEDLDAVLMEACRLVAEALGTERAKVLEIEAGGESLFVRAGVGWAPGIVGRLHLPMSEHSSETFSIRERVPVITQDIRTETRFEFPDFLKEAGVVAIANVPVILPGGTPYGLLQVDATEPREFGPDDTEFLRTYASLLGGAIDRLLKTEALRESEARFRSLHAEAERRAAELRAVVESMPDAVYMGGLDGITLVNQPALDQLGFTSRDELNRHVGTLAEEIQTRDAETGAPIPTEEQAFARALRGERVVQDVRVRHLLSGEDRVVRCAAAPVMIDGQVIAAVAVNTDVTDRRRAEDTLRTNEERFRAIVETATNYAIFTTDAEGRIETWPRGVQEVYGWTAEEAVGQPLDMTFTPEDREVGQPEKERQEARDTGQAPNVRWHLRKDGSRVFIDGVARPLTGPDGSVTGFVKVGQDVTERRATEAALRASDERFRQFGNASADVLWIRNAETLEFEYLSPAFQEVYGSSTEDLLSGNHMLRWIGMIVPDDRELALEHIRQVREGEQALNTFRILRRSDGAVRWIRDTSFPLRDAEGRVQRIGGIGHDATEEVELHDRLRVLVAELQHRTRNLMGVVRSVTDKTLSVDFHPELSRVGA